MGAGKENEENLGGKEMLSNLKVVGNAFKPWGDGSGFEAMLNCTPSWPLPHPHQPILTGNPCISRCSIQIKTSGKGSDL